ncbi:uncharacterized protein LOC135705218 [Ochlerotatus camptorhynchus]|uniref:uncharacterized protein LOC135705218 n=1 Tax=Ochlerotatus camptorhynchus TaxID=644619 RepID=UPI0031D972F4
MFLLLCIIIQVVCHQSKFKLSLKVFLHKASAWEQQQLLPARVMEMKDTLMHELQTLQDLIPGKHRADHQNDHEVQVIIDEFLAQNQESIEVVLRVLKLIDHDLENVIHDCERVFDLKTLSSANVIFGSVTKPLLVKVRDLCNLVAENRVDLLEAGLEAVEVEAFTYRGNLDQALQDIAVVSSQLESAVFVERALHGHEYILTSLKQVDQMFAEEISRNISMYSTKWLQLVRDFNAIISDNAVIDLDKHPEIATLYDVFDSLDNETTVLQEDMKDLMQLWVDLVEDVLVGLFNITEESDDYIREHALECFLNGEMRLTSVANYYRNLNHIMLHSLDKLYRCVDFEKEMGYAFRWMQPILASTDKAIGYIMKTYMSCAMMTEQVKSDLPFEMCEEEASGMFRKTQEFVESKVIEIYNHVIEAIELNEVTIEACLYAQLIDTFMLNGEYFESFENCSQSDNAN